MTQNRVPDHVTLTERIAGLEAEVASTLRRLVELQRKIAEIQRGAFESAVAGSAEFAIMSRLFLLEAGVGLVGAAEEADRQATMWREQYERVATR